MSKNFELLQKVEKEVQMFRGFPKPERSGSSNGNRLRTLPEPPPHDEIHKLVHRVFSPPTIPGPRMIIFTGVGEEAGSSSVCAKVARALAGQALGTVCAVDANLRSPSLHKYFKIENDFGFADGVMRPGPISTRACRVESGNLWVVPSGSHTGQLTSLVAVDRLAGRMKELREAFDYVLVNVPGADKWSDATVIGRLGDGAILVVEANSPSREVVRKARQSLEICGVRLLGTVLNKRQYPIPQFLYDRLG